MRFVIGITVVAAAAIGVARGGAIDEWTARFEATDDSGVAIAARCGDLRSWQKRTCEEGLSARFSSGDSSPQHVLRLHCTRVGSVWDAPLPEPPALCADRFGGWLSS